MIIDFLKLHQKQETREFFEKYLNSSRLKNELFKGGLYIAVFEILEKTVIDEIHAFFTLPNGADSEYYKEIEQHSPKGDREKTKKGEFLACVNWLSSMNFITTDDCKSLEDLRNYRNNLTHELAELLLSTKEEPILPDKLAEAFRLLDRIERAWIVNVHAPIISGSTEIKEAEVQGSRSALLGYIIHKVLAES